MIQNHSTTQLENNNLENRSYTVSSHLYKWHHSNLGNKLTKVQNQKQQIGMAYICKVAKYLR